MSKNSTIEWTDHTFNPWWGCVKVSPGCQYCYAETLSRRVGHSVWGPAATTTRRTFGLRHWDEPRRWNEVAQATGQRARVFCASMADVFEDHPQLPRERAMLWNLIEETPWLDWQLLTKRPENIRRMVPGSWLWPADGFGRGGWPLNVWPMTSVENQEQAERRIPELLRVPARMKGLSCEPLLGPVNLTAWLACCPSCGSPRRDRSADACGYCGNHPEVAGVGWVIAGGESGPKARPMHPDWPRVLRDQCQSAGVPFLFKQWGEYGPVLEPVPLEIGGDTVIGMRRLGKKAAGRLLDGRTWDEFPLPSTPAWQRAT